MTVDGDSIPGRAQVDGGVGGGLVVGWALPILAGRAYLQGVMEVGQFEESISSIVLSTAYTTSFHYWVFDFSVRPMIPILNRDPILFLSPAIGIGARIIRGTASYAAFWGGSLDLLGRSNIVASLEYRAVYSQLFLDMDPFISSEIRVVFAYWDDF
ncbi:MAG: hypothetical protein ABIJ00_10535 [Candidatus Eisenbacteria bacterium]